MEIHFCECCHARVIDADLRRGRGVKTRDLVICAACMDAGSGHELLEEAAESGRLMGIQQAETQAIGRVGEMDGEDDLYEISSERLPSSGRHPALPTPAGRSAISVSTPLDPSASLRAAACGFGALLANPGGESLSNATEENFGPRRSASSDDRSSGPSEPWRASLASRADEPTDELEILPDDGEDGQGDDVARARANSARSSGARRGDRSDSRRSGRAGAGNGSKSSRPASGSRSSRSADASRSGRSNDRGRGNGDRGGRGGSTRTSSRRPAKKNNNAMIMGISAVSVGLLLVITIVIAMSPGKAPPQQQQQTSGLSNPALESQISSAVQTAASAIASQDLGQIRSAQSAIKSAQNAYYAYQDQHQGDSRFLTWSNRTKMSQMQAMLKDLNEAVVKLEARR